MRPFLFLALAICLATTACYQPKKGCLDIEAVNFDATADEACCCEYPRLILQVEQRFDTFPWQPDTAYRLLSGQLFRLKSATFYLSEFRVYRGGEVLRVTDSLKLPVFGPGVTDTLDQTFINDFALVRRTPLDYAAGAFPLSGTFDRVEFLVGLKDDAQRVVPSKAPTTHPLATQTDQLWLDRDRGFIALRLIFARDTAATTLPDTLTLARPEFDNLLIGGNGTFVHESGYDFPVQLQIDYRELFRDVDLVNGNPTDWKARIVGNLPNAFLVGP